MNIICCKSRIIIFLDILINNKDVIAKYVDVKNLSPAAVSEFNLSVKVSTKKPIVIPGSSINAVASAGICDVDSEDDSAEDDDDDENDENDDD